MKSFLKVAFLSCSILLAGCAKQKTASDILKDEKTRMEIMTAICNDTTMSQEMFNRMTTTGVSQKMFPVTCDMLNRIMTSESMKHDTTMQNVFISNMLQLLSKDTVMCDKTCTQINALDARRLPKKR